MDKLWSKSEFEIFEQSKMKNVTPCNIRVLVILSRIHVYGPALFNSLICYFNMLQNRYNFSAFVEWKVGGIVCRSKTKARKM